MSVDRSLKSEGSLARHRNVLTRAERIEKLEDEAKWTEDENSVYGLPKVAHRKVGAGKKDQKEATPETELGAETTEDEATPETPAE